MKCSETLNEAALEAAKKAKELDLDEYDLDGLPGYKVSKCLIDPENYLDLGPVGEDNIYRLYEQIG